MSQPIQNRYEFVYLFDVENGNPNGDPDAGNLPRLDPETSLGLVTDVCLKRKVRNYVTLAAQSGAIDPAASPGKAHHIYVRERAVLNLQHQLAYQALELEPVDKKLPKDEAKARELTAWMCNNFYDVRTFGAVMTTKVNCGQVRGPVQFNFGRSIEPIVPLEVSITRMAVTSEEDAEKKDREMGRKHIVPYALYRAEGYISAPLAQQTGFDGEDLELLWDALCNMFEHDRSAARGKMCARRLFVFKHASKLGNAPAQKLFDLVTVAPTEGRQGPPRGFADYEVSVARDQVPTNVELEEMI